MREWFHRFAKTSADWMGAASAFVVSCLLVLVWAVTGPLYDYSDTWQLSINTFTTVVTYLMVFLIQNTQNRDSLALHLKLDELLRAVAEARTELVDLEEESDAELGQLRDEFRRLHQKARDGEL